MGNKLHWTLLNGIAAHRVYPFVNVYVHVPCNGTAAQPTAPGWQ